MCTSLDRFKRLTFALVGIITLVALAGCAQLERSTDIKQTSKVGTITLVNSFPENFLKGTHHYDSHLLAFVQADHASEFAAGLLVPIPFVSGAITDYTKKQTSKSLDQVYAGISPYQITYDITQGHPRIRESNGEFLLYPAAIIEDCYDDQYRISLLFQLEKDGWMGRYYYHLPTTIPKADIKSPTQEELRSFEKELRVGAEQLFTLVEDLLNGEQVTSTRKAEISSLFLVGGKLGGLTSPNLFRVKDAEIIAEDNSRVILRLLGSLKAKAKEGGMAYGVHHFFKNQLSHFEVTTDAN